MTIWQKLRWKLIVSAARILPPCCDIAHRISDARQRPLSLRDRLLVRTHLLVCDWCTSYSKQIILMSEAARRQKHAIESEGMAAHRLSEAARARMRALIDQGPV